VALGRQVKSKQEGKLEAVAKQDAKFDPTQMTLKAEVKANRTAKVKVVFDGSGPLEAKEICANERADPTVCWKARPVQFAIDEDTVPVDFREKLTSATSLFRGRCDVTLLTASVARTSTLASTVTDFLWRKEDFGWKKTRRSSFTSDASMSAGNSDMKRQGK
jgi:hypothetical protein